MVKILSCLLLLCCLCGCATEYNVVTGREESYYYSTEKEVQLGRAIARKVKEEYEAADDPLIQKRVEEIGARIAFVCDRKGIDYYWTVLENDEVNAFALPGGFIYVHSGLVREVASDDELAAVLAHEAGHIAARHSIKKLQALQGYSILRILLSAVPQTRQVGNAADIAFGEIVSGYSRKDELLADRLGARYAKRAGYDPKAMITFLERLDEINKRKPLRQPVFFRSHPYIPDRIREVKQELGQNMEFKDYINTEEYFRE